MLVLCSLRFTDLDCLADGHQYLVKENLKRDKNSILLMRKGTHTHTHTHTYTCTYVHIHTHTYTHTHTHIHIHTYT